MKITKALLLIAALLVITALCGCGAAGDSSKDEVKGGAVSADASSAVSDTGSSASSGDTQGQSSKAEPQYESIVKQLTEALSDVDKMGAGGLSMDEAKTIKKGDAEYAKVTDTRFASTADIEKFMKNALTDNLISTRYSSLTGTTEPRFIDDGGSLYEKVGARGGGFSWIDGIPQISDKTDKAFTAKVQYDDFGAASTMTLKIVLENGAWKIDSVVK